MKDDANDTPPATGRRGRSARMRARADSRARRAPYIARRIATFDILSAEGLETIEANADRILAEIGMEFRDDAEILAILHDAGADVRGERVRFEPGMCRALVTATAPITNFPIRPTLRSASLLPGGCAEPANRRPGPTARGSIRIGR